MFLKPEYKNEKAYAKYVDESGIFSNKLCNALPQTVIAKAVNTHMEGVGKTKKSSVCQGCYALRQERLQNN